MRSIPGGIDGLEAVFDDSCLVADGGLLLTGTVMHRLGLEAMVDETVRLDGRVAGSGSGRKVLTLVASMLVGGCCIDDVERLRAGASQAVCCRFGWWRRRLRGRFCGRSRSGMCASSTRRPSWGFAGRGLLARRPTLGR